MKIVAVITCMLIISHVSSQDLSQKVSGYLTIRNQVAPVNGSVLVTKGDQVIAKTHFGFSDLQRNTLIDSATLFPIASATKTFTAVAVFLLQEQGKLSINDPVIKWIPTLPSQYKTVQLKHLLSHTSGIPDLLRLTGTDKIPANLPSIVKPYQTSKQLFAAGDEFNYSNSNFILLSYVIEKASGSSYETFLYDKIFQPLKLNGTGFVYRYKGKAMAMPYRHAFKMDKVSAAELPNFALLKGAGGMYSTAQDLCTFVSGVSKLLSPASIKIMLKPVKGDYAMGWHVQQQFGKTVIKHPGGVSGYTTEMRYVLEDSMAVIILSNVGFNDLNIRYVAFDMLKLANNVPTGLDTAFGTYTGTYKLPADIALKAKTDVMQIKEKDGHLVLSIAATPEVYLVPFDKHKFFFYGEATSLEFEPSGDSVIILSPSLGKMKCDRKKP